MVPAFLGSLPFNPTHRALNQANISPVRPMEQGNSRMSLATPFAAARSTGGVEQGRGVNGGVSLEVLDPIREIDGVDEYLSTLEANQDKLIVLKIFAPWCRSCRAVTPKVNRLAREFSEILFVKMDYERNKELCKRLGVRIMPTFIFYAGAHGEIEKFSCGPARAGIIREKIENFINGQCPLPDNDAA